MDYLVHVVYGFNLGSDMEEFEAENDSEAQIRWRGMIQKYPVTIDGQAVLLRIERNKKRLTILEAAFLKNSTNLDDLL